MNRRDFVKTGAAVLAAGSLSTAAAKTTDQFKLKYAPGLGMFNGHAGKDPIDNIKFIHENGFRAIFDNGLMGKSPEMQGKIGNELAKLGMDLGPFVLYADFATESFVLNDKDIQEMLINRMKQGVECAKRSGAKYALVVPGKFAVGRNTMEWDYQTANVIDNLRRCVDVVEQVGLTIVLEPLNAWENHPGLFLTKIPQSYMICRAVNSPYCKIVDDMYHQQITEGRLIKNLEYAWDEIGAFHLGDTPGRNEPGTGEINYKNIFKHLYEKGCDKVLCMEHGKSIKGKEGELAVIEAYRRCDDF